MQQNNSIERKKRILTFAGLYAASIILMFFIFSAFGFHFSSGNQKATLLTNDRSELADNEILQADSLLHSKLDQLQASDDEYNLLLADTSARSLRNNAALIISMYESAFKKAIDSVDQLSMNYNGDKASMYKTMLNSFKSIAGNRQTLKNIQASMVSGKTVLPGGSLEILQLKNQLSLKENDLAQMSAQIKTLQGKDITPPKSAGTDEAQKGEIDLLKTAFNDQQKDYQAALEKYNRLKAENNSLATQVVELKKSASAQAENLNASTAAENKINSLEQKVQNLNADLYFAKVDCNLSRADAQQIISNARQRKELLSESLAMLNNLSASGDASIQKKAKDKIVRLNHIATTLHD
ncbi:MAG: hypothetical protein ABJB86_01380 [Bacteroidota bacterium]